MKNEVKVDELKKLMPSARTMVYFPIFGLQIFMVAFLFSSENIVFPLLLMIGAAMFTEGYEKSRLLNKLKRIIE
jgi:hypothetical protein